MAELVEGKLVSTTPIARLSETGDFLRPSSAFRGTILPQQAEMQRYHLFVSHACPWAHRTLIARKLKKIEDFISVSVTNPYMGEQGWTLDDDKDHQLMADVYVESDKLYTGKITVPVLWDKKNVTTHTSQRDFTL
jgi:glutathionyl-hydroquinone reductase